MSGDIVCYGSWEVPVAKQLWLRDTALRFQETTGCDIKRFILYDAEQLKEYVEKHKGMARRFYMAAVIELEDGIAFEYGPGDYGGTLARWYVYSAEAQGFLTPFIPWHKHDVVRRHAASLWERAAEALGISINKLHRALTRVSVSLGGGRNKAFNYHAVCYHSPACMELP